MSKKGRKKGQITPKLLETVKLIMQGIDYPKAIAVHTGVTSPSIMKRFDRLKALHLIRRGRKDGKTQHYLLQRNGLIELQGLLQQNIASLLNDYNKMRAILVDITNYLD
jgi:hypothetical protein